MTGLHSVSMSSHPQVQPPMVPRVWLPQGLQQVLGSRSPLSLFPAAEKVSSLGKDWHKFCLKCERCNKTLTPGGHAEHDGKPFCHKPCYATLFGPKGMSVLRLCSHAQGCRRGQVPPSPLVGSYGPKSTPGARLVCAEHQSQRFAVPALPPHLCQGRGELLEGGICPDSCLFFFFFNI